VTVSNSLVVPPVTNGTVGALWRSTNRLQFRDSTNGTRTLLNSEDNLSNLSDFGAARINLGLGYLGTNAATTIANLFASNSLPSGAAPEGAVLTAVGGQYVGVLRPNYLARQTTNGPTVTNGTTTSSLVISNVPAGLYWVQGQMNSTTVGGGRTWTLVAPNQVFGPRNLLGWFDSGIAAGFFNSSTNLLANADGATGTRNIAIAGPLMFTNTATISFNVTVSGATNTAQVLSNSFLFLRKID
jgi:hypothetical protein